jgi:hypothetical protein
MVYDAKKIKFAEEKIKIHEASLKKSWKDHVTRIQLKDISGNKEDVYTITFF